MTWRQFRTSFRVLLVLAVMFAGATTVAAQNSGASGSPDNSASTTRAAAVTELVAPGDLLDISVFGVPELTQQMRVAGDGKVQLALIGDTAVAGLTEEQAAEMIARELRERNFLIHPQVRVSIRESTMEGVSVLGEVQHPGVYQIADPRSLLDLISMAGGLTNVADTRITVKHRSTGGETVTVNLRNDDPKTALATDVQVYPGDLVVVPRAGIIYVLGDVARPGGYVMQDNGRITLLQALAQAGSPVTTAAANHAVLLRKTGEDYVTRKLDVNKIARGTERDFELQANDIVFIPDSRLKSALRNSGSLATTAASIGGVAIYGILH